MSPPKFAIGCSNIRNGREAIKEAFKNAETTLNEKPKAIMLFTTISYKKEIREILNTCKDLSDAPMVGGTVTGIVCNTGCFTRGIAIVLMAGDINVTNAIGRKVRKNPKKAAQEISKKITDKDKYDLIFNFCSGASEPSLLAEPTIGKIIRLLPNSIFLPLRDFLWFFSLKILGYGPGREEEFLSAMDEEFKDKSLIGFSTFDNWKATDNLQFFNCREYRNSATTMFLGFKNKTTIDIARHTLFVTSNKKFSVETGADGYFIDKINEKPAVDAYFSLMGWVSSYRPQHVYQNLNTTFYYPLGIADGTEFPYAFPAGLFIGNSIASNRKAKDREISIFLSSNRLFFDVIKDELEKIKKNEPIFTLFSVAAHVVGTIGAKLFVLKEILDKEHGEKPYIMIFGAGEHSKLKGQKTEFNNFTLARVTINPSFANSAIFRGL